MGLKRLPADLTFEAVRNRPSPLAGKSKVVDIAKSPPKPAEEKSDPKAGDERQNEAALSPENRADTPPAGADHAEPESARRVARDVEPSVKDKPAGSGLEVDGAAARKDDPQDTRPSDLNAKADRRSTTPAKSASSQGGTVVIKGRIAPPADGVVDVYDRVKARYGEKAAFKHLLGLALASYETAVLAGDDRALEEQPGFASHPPSRGTYRTRTVSKPFFATAKAALDPIEIMGPSAFGTAIMKNALAWYVATEGK